MTAESLCKGCRDDYKVTEEQIARILAGPMFSSPDVCVSDEVYQQRLSVCRLCSKLEGGFTCRSCGCIVPVVAKLKQRGCPLPGGGLWQPVKDAIQVEGD
ncbi:DUF6171 family protein [Gorillibacterium massiliense]|uniref:DUF6171 family protein n=1 Tax=Gorillibacterium massiliense TaxID=1280390 RepID=UPI000594A71D|nr:DUF6171 family protein [Gorillibacterium massiliense]